MNPRRGGRLVGRSVIIIVFVVGSEEMAVHDGVAKQGMLVTG
jgi:hypothetical protein